jgi:L-lactate dehydrogenase complex protein LldF
VTSVKPNLQRDTRDRRHEGIEGDVTGFNRRAREALRDDFLHGAVGSGTRRLVEGRNVAVSALPDAPALRERANAIKRETIANLDVYLEQLAAAVEARGGHVHFAADGPEVVRYVGDLARRRGAKVIVKSKSMATEEIELNRHLEEDYGELDLEIVETDLGEWVAQLAGDTPSHVIGPIMHLNRHQVVDIVSAVAGERLPTDMQEVARFARGRLRQKFLSADIGITGANFAVAETGTVCLVTNEGNARLCTSVPPVHVVVMGIEKVVPRLADLAVFTQLLTRSGTGQPITVYVSLVTGPRGPGEIDGPEELHLVLLDNGRSGVIGTDYEEALYCIRCGACLNVCPVYRQTGGHAYGSTYSGPIGAVITPLLIGDERAGDLPYASSLCGACSEVCPVGIPLHDLLLKLRARQVAAGTGGRAQGFLFAGFERAMTSPRLYEAGARLARRAQAPLVRAGSVRATPPTRPWTGTRELPPLAPKSFRELWREGIP